MRERSHSQNCKQWDQLNFKKTVERDHGHELSQLEPRRDGAARDTGRGPGVQHGVRRAEPVQEVERGLCEARRDERT